MTIFKANHFNISAIDHIPWTVNAMNASHAHIRMSVSKFEGQKIKHSNLKLIPYKFIKLIYFKAMKVQKNYKNAI